MKIKDERAKSKEVRVEQVVELLYGVFALF